MVTPSACPIISGDCCAWQQHLRTRPPGRLPAGRSGVAGRGAGNPGSVSAFLDRQLVPDPATSTGIAESAWLPGPGCKPARRSILDRELAYQGGACGCRPAFSDGGDGRLQRGIEARRNVPSLTVVREGPSRGSGRSGTPA
jgi:hypothetical protein